jgi:hypothetical protein
VEIKALGQLGSNIGNSVFRSKFSQDIFAFKYAHEGAETWGELAWMLAFDVCGDLLRSEEHTSELQSR